MNPFHLCMSFLVKVPSHREAEAYRRARRPRPPVRDSRRALGRGTRRLFRDRPGLPGHGFRVGAHRRSRRARSGPWRARSAAVPARPACTARGCSAPWSPDSRRSPPRTSCSPFGAPAAPSSGSACSSTASATRPSPGRRHGCFFTCRGGPNEGDGSLERAGVYGCCTKSWGAAVLEIAGAAVVLGGLWEIGQGLGLSGRLPFRRDVCPAALAKLLTAISRFGLVARGATLAALGYFPDPRGRRAGSFGGADGRRRSRRLRPHAARTAFMAVTAAGLAAYGVYMAGIALAE